MMYFFSTSARALRFHSTPLLRMPVASFLVFCLVSLCTTAAKADMVIETTRIIYPESKRDVSFKVSNSSKERPAFVQMWLDDGNASAAPEDAVTPFNLTPPVARIKTEGSQVVRLVYTGEPLPTDKESVFWFNMLEVPQKSKEENRLSFAIRTRIKVFFRPKLLKGEPTDLMEKLSWKIVNRDNKWMVEGQNPTPYHMSFFSFSLGNGSQFDTSIDGGMVPPMTNGSFPIPPERKAAAAYNRIKVEFINDYGGVVSKEFPITSAN